MKLRLLLAAALLLSCLSAQAAAPIVALRPSLSRLGQTEAFAASSSIQIYAAKGETTACQVAVKAPAGGLTNLSVSVGGGIPSSVWVERYVQVAHGSWVGGQNRPLGPGWYADALQAGAWASLAAGVNCPFWVDVKIPAGQAAGDYSLPVTVTSDQGSATATINLRVWNFSLPVKPALRSCFRYDSMSKKLQPTRLLVEHRLQPRLVNPAHEASLLPLGFKMTHLGFWGCDDNSSPWAAPPTAAQVTAAKALHNPAVELYDYPADEISDSATHVTNLKKWAAVFHPKSVKMLVTMRPSAKLFNDGTGRSVVDIWVVLPKMYDDSKSLVAQALAKGDEVWSYNCNQQDDYSPKWLLDYAPINYRIQPGFINFSLGLTGILYWQCDYWSSDPWNNGEKWAGYPGEGMLVYPTKAGLPVATGADGVAPSMRLKWLRDGATDYDYLVLLAAQNPTLAKSIANRIGLNWTTWTRDPVALEAARIEMGAALSGGAPPPPPPPPPPPTDTLTVTAAVSPQAVKLQAAATDSLGHALTYAWSDGGVGGTFTGGTSSTPTYQPTPGAKTITISVTVTCSGGKTASAQIVLSVPG